MFSRLRLPWRTTRATPACCPPSRRRPSLRLTLERLEDRTVPTISLAPTNISASAGTAFSGTVATFTDSDPNATASIFTAVVNWGDGASSPGDGQKVSVVADPVTHGQFDVQGTHTYAQSGSFSLQVAVSDNQGNTSTSMAFFRQADLVTDNQTNLTNDGFPAAAHVDPNLVNPWGISFGPGGPFWIANNNTGTTTLYDGSGASQGGAITLPTSANAGASAVAPVTGTVFNGTSDFNVAGPNTPALFIFASEDGTITAWYAGSTGSLKVDNADFTNGPVYKGLAIGSNTAGNFLYATNFRTGTIDVFDKNFSKVTLNSGVFGSFADPNQDMTGYAPFGIQNIGGKLYVTYALQDPARHDDVGGAGNGFIDVFDTSGHFIQRLVSHGQLDSPWGLALAPAGFGAFGGDLLVGNFKDGHINVFDPKQGTFLGQLTGPSGQPITIHGLWGLAFGNGAGAGATSTLYFTAGLNGEAHGVFGSFTAVPASGGTASVTPAGFVYDPAAKTLTVNATNFAFTQMTTADAAGLHTTYTFTADNKVMSMRDVDLNRVMVNGTGAGAVATLVTSDTYVATNGQTQETAETVIVGSHAATVDKTDIYGDLTPFVSTNGFSTEFAILGRADVGLIVGTSGVANTLITAGHQAYMYSGASFYYVSGARYVSGYSANAGDTVYHYDAAGAGPSYFLASGTSYSYMIGTENGLLVENFAYGFTFNVGIAQHSTQDVATFYDSPGNDMLVGFTVFTLMSRKNADGTYAEYDAASGFAHVTAYSFVGGFDTATNLDPSHNTFVGFH